MAVESAPCSHAGRIPRPPESGVLPAAALLTEPVFLLRLTWFKRVKGLAPPASRTPRLALIIDRGVPPVSASDPGETHYCAMW